MSAYDVAMAGGDLEAVFADWQGDESCQYDVEELTDDLATADRFDLLEQLKDHPVFGEAAQTELRIKASLPTVKRAWAAKVEEYPPLFKEWREILIHTPRIGLYDISYPSQQAMQAGLGDKYVAIFGDDLFLFMFEVVSLDGEGEFRFWTHPTFPPDVSCDVFCQVAHCQIGSLMTGTQITGALRQIYGPLA